jgi:hopanoid-associated phosphorylase
LTGLAGFTRALEPAAIRLYQSGMDTGRVIAVTGLKREAAILRSLGVTAIAGGGDHRRLESALELAAKDASGVISIGLAGALDPTLKTGDWIVADAVFGADAASKTDPVWTRRLLAALQGSTPGVIIGSDVMVASANAKRGLYFKTGALAVDMESHIGARIAARHGLPFAVARVISDRADHSLPRAAQAGMKSDGGMRVAAVLAKLALHPGELPALIRTGREAEIAFRALLRGRELLGPALMGPGPDLG